MKLGLFKLAVASLLTASVFTSQAAIVVLDFEGVGNFAPVGNFYNGGAGTDYNIDFGSGALGIVDSDAGGGGNFGGEPSPDTVLFFLSGSALMNVNDGFTTGFSFFYSAVNQPGFVNVYDGLNGTGNLLASINLPVTPSLGGDPNGDFSPFFPIGVTFAGTAMSVDFAGTADQIAFDNVTFGTEVAQGAVPEPSTVFGGLAIGALALRRALRRK